MLPDLDRLNTFATFAELLNFTRAAERLHLTQPAVHVQIAKLSESLGVPLYRRAGRKLELTEEGKRVAAFARELHDRTAAFTSELTGNSDSRPVVLAAGAGAYLYLLGGAIKSYLQNPRARLRLLTLDGPLATDRVLAGEAHLGVAVIDAIPEGLAGRKLVRVEPVLAMPADHPLASKSALELAHLEGARLIVPPEGRPQRRAISQAMRAAGVGWEVSVEAGGWDLTLHFVTLGLGLAIVNGCVTLPEGVISRPLSGLPASDYYLFHRPGALHGESARLAEHLIAATREPTTKSARASSAPAPTRAAALRSRDRSAKAD